MFKYFLFFFILLNSNAVFSLTIGYYNPDINYPATDIISAAADYSKEIQTDFEIQPVSKFDILKKNFISKDFLHIIIPPYFASSICADSTLICMFTPIDKNGRNTYTKHILVRKKEISSMSDLKNKIIASSSYGSASIEVVNKYIFSETNFKAEDIDFVWVKKDLDAIFSLIFGQVDAAIVSKNTIQLMNKERPEQMFELQELYESKPMPLPCVFSVDSLSFKFLESAFLKMNIYESGKKFISLLGVSQWQIK